MKMVMISMVFTSPDEILVCDYNLKLCVSTFKWFTLLVLHCFQNGSWIMSCVIGVEEKWERRRWKKNIFSLALSKKPLPNIAFFFWAAQVTVLPFVQVSGRAISVVQKY